MATQHGLLHGVLAAAIEGGIDALLTLYPDKTDLLLPLAGKMIALHMEPFGDLFYLCVTPDDIKVLAETTAMADVSLKGPLAAFASLGLSREYRVDPAATGLKFEGDPKLIETVLHLLAHIDFNPASSRPAANGPVVRSTDAEPTRPLALPGWLQTGIGWGEGVAQTLRQNLAEYWQEESRELPGANEISAFTQEITRIEQMTAQCEQRLERLMAQNQRSASS